MKALAVEVDWMFDWGNRPKLKFFVDKLPEMDNYDYTILGNSNSQHSRLYYAEKDGFVDYLLDTTNPDGTSKQEDGFAGRHFEIILKGGQKMVLKGPWSSRSGVVNKYFDNPCMEVTITDDLNVWEGGFTFFAGNVTVEFAKQAISEFLEDIEIISIEQYGETYYTPVWTANPCEHGNINGNGRCVKCKHKVYKENKEDVC